MKTSEKIIQRLNKGFGFNLPLDTKFKTHQANSQFSKANAAHAWFISDDRVSYDLQIGCCQTMTECLKWKRWVIDTNPWERELFEYFEDRKEYCEKPHDYKFLFENENK